VEVFVRHTLAAADERRQQQLARAAVDEDRLAWVVEFVNDDILSRPSTDRIARGYQLKALAGVASPGPMPDRQILHVHRTLRAGLKAAFAKEGLGWSLPMQRTWLRLSPMGQGRRDYRFARLGQAKNDHDAIVGTVVRLIEFAGSQLRTCAVCETFFLGVKRQEYCTTTCSQVMRNNRKKEPK
jgi:hypothetical protein